MNDIGRMDIKHAPQNLVEKILNVLIGEILTGIYNSVQIRFHQVSKDVNVGKTGTSGRLSYLTDVDDVLMIEEF